MTDAHGAIIRGDVDQPEIALVLTADEYADGSDHIRRVFNEHHIKASFFLTGNFYRNPEFSSLIKELKVDGHYLGAHSDRHLLYADWKERDSLLVTEEEFMQDLLRNYQRMAQFGITQEEAPYFLPPYEWYNSKIADWTKEIGFQLVNFTPGTRSAADYTYPQMGNRYLSSEAIYQSIMAYEQKDEHGLNGFILLVHLGTDPRRTDKFYYRLDELLTTLRRKGYYFIRIDELLE